MKQKRITPELTEYIKQHYDGKSETITEIQNKFNVPRYIITAHALKLGMSKKEFKDWTDDDIAFLIESWGNKTEKSIAEKLNRTVTAVHLKAKRLGLGGMVKGSRYLTANNVSNFLQLDIHSVTRWLKEGLLKYKKAKVNRVMYLIEFHDLEEFLKNNQDKWDSRKMQGSLWIIEPDWIKEKRKQDNLRPANEAKRWTPVEDRIVLDLYRSGMKLKEIGIRLGRSHEGVERRINRLFKKAECGMRA